MALEEVFGAWGETTCRGGVGQDDDISCITFLSHAMFFADVACLNMKHDQVPKS